MTTQTRARLMSLVVLGVVFASGIVVGFALDRGLDTAEADAARVEGQRSDGRPARGSDEGERRRRVPMYEQVNLTEQQRVRIDSIVKAYREDLQVFHRNSRKAYEEGTGNLVLETRDAIRGVLDPDQAARYDSLTAAWDARNRDSGGSGGSNRN